MEIWGLEWLGRSIIIYCEKSCTGAVVFRFDWDIAATQTHVQCVQHWYSLWAAPDTCLFPPNRLAEDVNTMNQIPLTTDALVSPTGTFRKALLCVLHPSRHSCLSQWSAEIYLWLQASGWDRKSGTCKLPVIWQLKAMAGGDGSGGNQGV